MKFLSISNARKKLADLVGLPERTAITRNGEPMSVLLSVEDYRALVANQVLARDPEGLRQIVADHRRVQAGDLTHTRVIDLEGNVEAAAAVADPVAVADGPARPEPAEAADAPARPEPAAAAEAPARPEPADAAVEPALAAPPRAEPAAEF